MAISGLTLAGLGFGRGVSDALKAQSETEDQNRTRYQSALLRYAEQQADKQAAEVAAERKARLKKVIDDQNARIKEEKDLRKATEQQNSRIANDLKQWLGSVPEEYNPVVSQMLAELRTNPSQPLKLDRELTSTDAEGKQSKQKIENIYEHIANLVSTSKTQRQAQDDLRKRNAENRAITRLNLALENEAEQDEKDAQKLIDDAAKAQADKKISFGGSQYTQSQFNSLIVKPTLDKIATLEEDRSIWDNEEAGVDVDKTAIANLEVKYGSYPELMQQLDHYYAKRRLIQKAISARESEQEQPPATPEPTPKPKPGGGGEKPVLEIKTAPNGTNYVDTTGLSEGDSVQVNSPDGKILDGVVNKTGGVTVTEVRKPKDPRDMFRKPK